MTSRFTMILRTAMVPWKLVLCLCILFGVVPSLGLLAVVIGSVAAMMYGVALGVKLLAGCFYGGDPDYQKFRANGGHPFWNFLPPPVNNDSFAVRAGGNPEPPTEYTPPTNWLVQCNACGARNQDYGICWHCGSNLAGAVALAPVQGPCPRVCSCPGCHQQVQEVEFGCFENGVRCPYCQIVMQIIPVQPDPSKAPRVSECSQCHRDVREAAYGNFETGVQCPYCGWVLYTDPQAV